MKSIVERCEFLSYRKREYIQPYIMILPSITGMAIFVIYPMIWVLRFCLFSYDGFSIPQFVGLDNFIRAFTRDNIFWGTVLNTFILAIGKLSIELPVALVLAYILDKKIKFRNLFRVVYFLPTIVSVAIIGIIFFFLFSSFDGIVNSILLTFNIISRPINWFETKLSAMFILAVASIWQNFGLNMVLFLTGLQSIPMDVYESAEIDGANEVQKFFFITIPMLGPVLKMILMIALLGSLKIVDLVMVLTQGRPGGKSEVMMTYIYKLFFGSGGSGTSPDFGYAAALAVITSLILTIVTILYLRFSRKRSSIN